MPGKTTQARTRRSSSPSTPKTSETQDERLEHPPGSPDWLRRFAAEMAEHVDDLDARETAVARAAAELALPMADAAGYVPRHVQVALAPREGSALAALLRGLNGAHATIPSRHAPGRVRLVESLADAVRWLLHRAADQDRPAHDEQPDAS